MIAALRRWLTFLRAVHGRPQARAVTLGIEGARYLQRRAAQYAHRHPAPIRRRRVRHDPQEGFQ